MTWTLTLGGLLLAAGVLGVLALLVVEVRRMRRGLLVFLEPLAAEATLVENKAPCLHPPEARQDFSTLTASRWRCRECGFSVGLEDVRGF
jgi:hypothetical protein